MSHKHFTINITAAYIIFQLPLHVHTFRGATRTIFQTAPHLHLGRVNMISFDLIIAQYTWSLTTVGLELTCGSSTLSTASHRRALFSILWYCMYSEAFSGGTVHQLEIVFLPRLIPYFPSFPLSCLRLGCNKS